MDSREGLVGCAEPPKVIGPEVRESSGRASMESGMVLSLGRLAGVVLMLIRNFWITAWIASPGVLPKRLNALHEELALLILPKRRARHYPRAVKIKMSSYPRKR